MITLFLGKGSNIRADGSRYKQGLLGLSLFPSETAKRNAQNYEQAIFKLMSKLWFKFTSSRVMLEIYKYRPKTVTIIPRDIEGKDEPARKQLIGPPDPQELMCNAFAKPDDRVKAITKGAPAPDPDLEDQWKDHTVGSGEGTDSTVFFNPGVYRDYGGKCFPLAPAFSADEVLLHELVHGMSGLRGRLASTLPGPQGYRYDNLEEFTAVLITNIYISEKGLQGALSADHEAGILKAPLTDDKVFFQTFKDDMMKVCTNHGELAVMLKTATGIGFNPFKFT
jgi:hypothetical protein